MRDRRRADRPSVALTQDERRQFAEIAGRLRYELDGLGFDAQPERWWHRFGTRASHLAGRSARATVGLAGRWWTAVLLLLAGPATLAAAPLLDRGTSAGPVAVRSLLIGGAVLTVCGLLALGRLVRHRWAERARSGGSRTGRPSVWTRGLHNRSSANH